jgi:hypothetical protein
MARSFPSDFAASGLHLNRSGPGLITLGLLLAFGYGTLVWRRRRFERAEHPERDGAYRPAQGSNDLELHATSPPPTPGVPEPPPAAGSGQDPASTDPA